MARLAAILGLALGLASLARADTLYLTTLTAQCAAAVLGSGSSSLLLSDDQSAARVRFQFSNLTGAITSKHIHASDGQILFDLDTSEPDVGGVYLWRIVPAGTYSTAQIRAALANSELFLNLHTAACPSGEIRGFFKLATGGQTFSPPAPPPALPAAWSKADAARFLTQATFGPTVAEIEALYAELKTKGAAAFDTWIVRQFALPVVRHIGYLDALRRAPHSIPADDLSPDHIMESFWDRAVNGPDQLRQRLALALSEILVVSDVDSDVWSAPAGMASYLDILQRGAFGGYRKLLQNVALSPTMGVYLDQLSNDRSDAETGRKPNENFAREILQLFSIGLYRLHPDGSLKLGADDGLPLATYGQEEVTGFAAIFTGWTHARQNRSEEWRFYWPEPQFRLPMEPWEEHHEPGPKRLLDGFVQPGGQAARADLKAALDRVFAHPNVGPFLCRQLIQRLVTSNPSPAYVYRCAQAFAANSTGARGDMKSVVRAILMDFEARSPAIAAQPGFGKLREGIVRFGALLRALEATTSTGDRRLRYYWLDSPEWGLGQNPLRAPTVFNFFEPSHSHPGEVAQAGLVSPEFKIATETTVFGTPNFLRGVVFEGWMADDDATPVKEELRFNWPAWTRLNNARLLDRINLLFYAGSMSAETRNILRTALADPDFVWPPDDRLRRVKELIWLTFLSPEALVQK
jgi:uncharacterized protein (DUF1800 family)